MKTACPQLEVLENRDQPAVLANPDADPPVPSAPTAAPEPADAIEVAPITVDGDAVPEQVATDQPLVPPVEDPPPPLNPIPVIAPPALVPDLSATVTSPTSPALTTTAAATATAPQDPAANRLSSVPAAIQAFSQNGFLGGVSAVRRGILEPGAEDGPFSPASALTTPFETVAFNAPSSDENAVPAQTDRLVSQTLAGAAVQAKTSSDTNGGTMSEATSPASIQEDAISETSRPILVLASFAGLGGLWAKQEGSIILLGRT